MARRRKKSFGFAQATAGDVNPLWGAVASGLAGTGTAIGIRAMTGLDKNAELIGMGVGVAAGVGLMLSPKTRAAGFTGVVTALVTNGIRYAEALVSPKQQLKDLEGAKAAFLAAKAETKIPLATQLQALEAEAAAAGFGIVSAERIKTLGALSAQQVPTLGALTAERRQLAGNGLGIVSPEVVRSLGNQQPVGQGDSPVQIVGSQGGFGQHYGATIFG